MTVDLALAEFEVAREDIEAFLSHRLRELISDQETQDLIERLSTMLSSHSDRMRELMQAPKLAMEGVCQRVTLGMLTQQPLEMGLLPWYLRGTGQWDRLSPSGGNQSTSLHQGGCFPALGCCP